MKKFNTVIIGGGLAGLYAAYKSAKNGETVCLIDKSIEIGGLMGSRKFHDEIHHSSYEFDFGIHYLLLTGHEKIDREITEFITPDEWHWFENSLPEGHVYNSTLDEETGCIDVRNSAQYDKILSEFFSSNNQEKQCDILSEKIENDFGQKAHYEIFQPICKKLTGLTTDRLAPEAYGVFGPYRLKILHNSEIVKKLKELPDLDRRLAFPNTKDGKSSMRKAYPKAGQGIGLWVRELIKELEKNDVHFYLNTTITNYEIQGQSITTLELSEQNETQKISCDRVITGLAPGLLGRMFNIAMPSAPPQRRHMLLLHYVLDKPYNIKNNHWITIYDPNFEAFRVTLYDNISTAPSSQNHRVTVEVLQDSYDHDRLEDLKTNIFNELKRLKIIPQETLALCSFCDICSYAVPILLPGWKETLKEQSTTLQNAIQNLTPVGLASGVHFGQVATLRSVYKAFNK